MVVQNLIRIYFRYKNIKKIHIVMYKFEELAFGCLNQKLKFFISKIFWILKMKTFDLAKNYPKKCSVLFGCWNSNNFDARF